MNRRSSYATSKDIPVDDDEGFRFRRSRTGSAWDRHYTVPDYDLAEKRSVSKSIESIVSLKYIIIDDHLLAILGQMSQKQSKDKDFRNYFRPLGVANLTFGW